MDGRANSHGRDNDGRAAADSISSSRSSVTTAIAANGAIALLKFVAAATTGSVTLLAEGFHSSADSGNQLLLLLGMHKAAKPPDRRHPFGYGKERFFWAFVVAVNIFTIGAALSIYEGTLRILRGTDRVASLPIALGVLGIAAIFESVSWVRAYRPLARSRGRASWWAVVRNTKNAELLTVLLEDSAALLGIALAASSIVLARLTGIDAFDGVGAILVGALLGLVALVLGRECKALLLGEAASPGDVRRLRNAASIPEVDEIVELRTMHLAPDQLLVALRVRFRNELDESALVNAIERIEQRVRHVVPLATWILVEPSADATEPIAPERGRGKSSLVEVRPHEAG